MTRTKIIASLGPSVFEKKDILRAAKAGMDIARTNMSHSSHSWHSKVIERTRKAGEELGRKIPVLMDIQGPCVRTGEIPINGGFIRIKKGDSVVFTIKNNGSKSKIFVNYPEFIELVDKNSLIFLSDGAVQLRVVEKTNRDVICESLYDAKIKSRSTLSVFEKSFNLPALTEKDWKDIEFGVKKGVEYFGISFVKTGKEIVEIRNFLTQQGSKAKIIAKIETPEAIQNLENIIKVSDAVMIARGDLGVTLPLEHTPFHQYNIIKKCKDFRKFVVVATQMLHSMKNKPIPTRAEVNDVFTAVVTGSDAIMLSDETAEGKYPIETIQYARKIIKTAEKIPYKLSIHTRSSALSEAQKAFYLKEPAQKAQISEGW